MEILIYIAIAVAILVLIGFILGSVEHGSPREFNDYLNNEEEKKKKKLKEAKEEEEENDIRELEEEEEKKEKKYERNRKHHIDKQVVKQKGIDFLELNENAKYTFYYLRVMHKSKPYYKIGITKFTAKERYENWTDESITYNYDILFEVKAKKAKRFEQCLKDIYKPVHLHLLGTKGTEIFDRDILNIIEKKEELDLNDIYYYDNNGFPNEEGKHDCCGNNIDDHGHIGGIFDEHGFREDNGEYDIDGNYIFIDDDDKFCVKDKEYYTEIDDIYMGRIDPEEEDWDDSIPYEDKLYEPYWVNDFNRWAINNEKNSYVYDLDKYNLPSEKKYLQLLEELYISNCEDLPISIKYLYSLEEIVFGKNGKYISPRLQNVYWVKSIVIENSNIERLPEWLGETEAMYDGFCDLHTLDLSKAPNINLDDPTTKKVIKNLEENYATIIYSE